MCNLIKFHILLQRSSEDTATWSLALHWVFLIIFLVRFNTVHLYQGLLLYMIYVGDMELFPINSNLVSFPVHARHRLL